MPTLKLTDAAIEKIVPPLTGRTEYFDAVVPGLHLRVTDRGVMTFALMTRLDGRQMRLTLGRCGVITLSEARARARIALNQIESGIDPREERRRAAREAPITLADAAARFIEGHAKRNTHPTTARETERMLRLNVLPHLGTRPLAGISRAEILERLDAMIADDKPVAANRCLAVLQTLFRWCVERQLLAVSPAAGIRKPTVERSRERVLTDDETGKLWRAWTAMGHPYGTLGKLLLLTGQRRSEVAGMRWADIDEEKAVWTLPAHGTKARRSHEVPLSSLVIALLRHAPRLGAYVLADWGGPERPPTAFSQAKVDMDALSGVTGWTLHDLRRTAGTGMAKLGVPVFVIGRVLNHAESGVTRIYARASYLEEKRQALEAWAQKVAAIVGEERPASDGAADARRTEPDEPRGLLRPLGTRAEASSGMIKPQDGEVIILHPPLGRSAN